MRAFPRRSDWLRKVCVLLGRPAADGPEDCQLLAVLAVDAGQYLSYPLIFSPKLYNRKSDLLNKIRWFSALVPSLSLLAYRQSHGHLNRYASSYSHQPSARH